MCETCEQKTEEIEAERTTVYDIHGAPALFLAVYEVYLAYGGPEEGGWWYQTEELRRVVTVPSLQVIPLYRRDLEKKYPREGDRPVSSVAYQGGSYSVVEITDGKMPLEHLPVITPHYE